MRTRPALDVSRLSPIGFDTHDPTWWGNLLLLGIETTTVALLLATYFYLWQANYPEWPPTQGNRLVTAKDPVPRLVFSTTVALLLLGSCWPMYRADQAARRMDYHGVWWGLVIQTTIAVVAFVLQCVDLTGLQFYWDENAYASTVWSIIGLHLFYLFVAAVEAGALLLWVTLYGLDPSRAVDTTIMGLYWYWTVAIWWAMYAVVYWSPRLV